MGTKRNNNGRIRIREFLPTSYPYYLLSYFFANQPDLSPAYKPDTEKKKKGTEKEGLDSFICLFC
jgi:hypothetical protein